MYTKQTPCTLLMLHIICYLEPMLYCIMAHTCTLFECTHMHTHMYVPVLHKRQINRQQHSREANTAWLPCPPFLPPTLQINLCHICSTYNSALLLGKSTHLHTYIVHSMSHGVFLHLRAGGWDMWLSHILHYNIT